MDLKPTKDQLDNHRNQLNQINQQTAHNIQINEQTQKNNLNEQNNPNSNLQQTNENQYKNINQQQQQNIQINNLNEQPLQQTNINQENLNQSQKQEKPKKKGLFQQIKNVFHQQVAQDGIQIIKQKYEKIKNSQSQNLVILSKLEQEVKNQFGKLSNQQKNYLVNQKEALNQWGKRKIIVIIIKFLEKSQPIVYEFLTDDPYMPESVKDFIKEILEEYWPSIQQKILEEFQQNMNLKKKGEIQQQEEQFQVTCCLKKLTALYLYQKNPYDKSFWYQIKQISYWIITILELIPYYSIQSFLHIFIFLIIDKTDEWQLIRYIINYKIKQFFSYCIIYGFVGYVMYFNCYTFQDKNLHEDRMKCSEQGPGYELSLLVDSIGFLLQILLIWQCYFWLKCSKKLQKEQQTKQKVHSKSSCLCCKISKRNGGRLKAFLLVDLFFFVICLIPIILIVVTDKYDQDYQLRSTIFLMKIAYGLFSGIFLIFIFDPLTELITHSQRTGYDRFGNVRIFKVKNSAFIPKQIEEKKKLQKIQDNQNKYTEDNQNVQIQQNNNTLLSQIDENEELLDQKLFDDIL